MNEDVFNMSVRKFLKKVGITAQREIENTVREALSKGSLTGKEKLPAKVTLTLGQTSLNLVVDGIDPQADLAAIVVRIGQAWRRPQAP
jgi:Family of unknown function (DUF6494)